MGRVYRTLGITFVGAIIVGVAVVTTAVVPLGAVYFQQLDRSSKGRATDVSWLRSELRYSKERLVAYTSEGFALEVVDILDHNELGLEGYMGRRIQAGWPFLAFEGFEHGGWGFPRESVIVIATRKHSDDWTEELLAPTKPIWLGVIANIVFYAASTSILVVGGIVGRRMIRRKRGRCPRCAFDLRGEFDRGCPECGWGRGT